MLSVALRDRAFAVDADAVVVRILREMNECEARARPALGAVALRMVAVEPALARHFGPAAQQMTVEHRRFWGAWLGELIACRGTLDASFLRAMFAANPMPFLGQIRDLACSGGAAPAALQEITDAIASKETERCQAQNHQFYAFFDDCIEDLRKLEAAAALTLRLYKALARGEQALEPDLAAEFPSLDALVAHCEEHPPVFTTTASLHDFFRLQQVKLPLFGHYTTRVSLEANGQREAVLRLIQQRGESTLFVLLAPSLYRFSHREFLLMSAIGARCAAHPGSSGRANFVWYPASFRIHPLLVAVDIGRASTLRDIAQPFALARLVAARGPDDRLHAWTLRGCDGNRSNFLVARSAFAAHLAAVAFFQGILGRDAPLFPPLLCADDRRRICAPGFIDEQRGRLVLPLTDQIKRLLPEFVIRGAFAAAWHTAADGLAKAPEKIRPLVEGLIRDSEWEAEVMHKIEKIAVAGGRDTDKTDAIWAFDLLDHLIESSNRVLHADGTKIGWI
jgi:hypothetical protein